MTSSAINAPSAHRAHASSPNGYAIGAFIIFSPLILAVTIIGGLGYGMYAGIRLAAKQIAIATNKEQGERLQLIAETALMLQKANTIKTKLEEKKVTNTSNQEELNKLIAKVTAIAAMENPIKPQDVNSQPEGPKELLTKAQELIESQKKRAEQDISSYQFSLKIVTKDQKETAVRFQKVETRIAKLSEILKTTQKLYQDAGPLSKIKESLITWKSVFNRNSEKATL